MLGRSTLMLYEAIEFEPSTPAAVLQFADIRDVLKKELTTSAVRGVVLAMPNAADHGAAEPVPLCPGSG